MDRTKRYSCIIISIDSRWSVVWTCFTVENRAETEIFTRTVVILCNSSMSSITKNIVKMTVAFIRSKPIKIYRHVATKLVFLNLLRKCVIVVLISTICFLVSSLKDNWILWWTISMNNVVISYFHCNHSNLFFMTSSNKNVIAIRFSKN